MRCSTSFACLATSFFRQFLNAIQPKIEQLLLRSNSVSEERTCRDRETGRNLGGKKRMNDQSIEIRVKNLFTGQRQGSGSTSLPCKIRKRKQKQRKESERRKPPLLRGRGRSACNYLRFPPFTNSCPSKLTGKLGIFVLDLL